VENISRLAAHVRAEMSKVIVGQQEVIDQLLLVLICGGHALIEGVPGLAKTLAVKTMAKICSLGFQRVQCTADLMPADVMGTNIFNMSTSSFSLHRGPFLQTCSWWMKLTGPRPHAGSASGGHGGTAGYY